SSGSASASQPERSAISAAVANTMPPVATSARKGSTRVLKGVISPAGCIDWAAFSATLMYPPLMPIAQVHSLTVLQVLSKRDSTLPNSTTFPTVELLKLAMHWSYFCCGVCPGPVLPPPPVPGLPLPGVGVVGGVGGLSFLLRPVGSLKLIGLLKT